MQLLIGECALIARFAFPNKRGFVAAPSRKVPIQAVVGNIQLSAEKPLSVWWLPLQNLVPFPEPVEFLGHSGPETFRIGGSKTLCSSGQDRLTVVAAGVTVGEAMKAHDQLAAEGIAIRVVDAYSVKPIDADGLLEAAAHSNNRLIVVEDHYYDGGLGDAVLNAVVNHGVRVYKLAVQEIPRSGKPEELLQRYGIGSESIVQKDTELMLPRP